MRLAAGRREETCLNAQNFGGKASFEGLYEKLMLEVEIKREVKTKGEQDVSVSLPVGEAGEWDV